MNVALWAVVETSVYCSTKQQPQSNFQNKKEILEVFEPLKHPVCFEPIILQNHNSIQKEGN
jgi:hypothetical protein